MKNTTTKKLFKLSAVALASLGAVSSNAFANDYSSITSLPIISDTCGVDSCFDRRNMSFEQVYQILSDASDREMNSSFASESKDPAGMFYGIRKTPQLVYLNFEQSSPTFEAITFSGVPETFNSYNYTQEERDTVQANLEADYAAFNVRFTQTQPTTGEYSTLNFECQVEGGICIDFGSGILFGRAQSIDLGNTIRDDVAFVDANLWQVIVEIDPTGGFLTSLTGIPVENGDVQAALSTAIINQASNTGAHELGHNMGLRHHDSFGSPGNGLPTTGVPSPSAFYPVFEGLQEGDEAILHTMASGASVGSGLSDGANRDTFFSERSAIKLKAAEKAKLVMENDNMSSGWDRIDLKPVKVPNTIIEGANAGKKLGVRGTIVQGAISASDEVDYYRFRARGGNTLSAEFNGFDAPVSDDTVIGALRLFYVNRDGSLTLVAQNFQNFEGFDAFLIDAPLEKDGDYIIEVTAPDDVRVGINPDGTPQLISLDENGFNDLRSGDYYLTMYVVSTK